jgi:membrane protein implicated in regulation of membrane protease activity
LSIADAAPHQRAVDPSRVAARCPREARINPAILAAAVELMAERGVNDLCIDDVARPSSVSRSCVGSVHEAGATGSSSFTSMLVVLAIVALFVLPSPWGVVALAAALAVEVFELLFWRRFLRRYRLRVGPETLVGMRAEVVQPLSPVGLVRLRGELWSARANATVEQGETVTVSGIEGLTLRVEHDTQ